MSVKILENKRMGHLLAGKNIVITRPTHQAMQIQGLLEQQQAKVILFPVIEIQPNNPVDLFQVEDADWLIFISPNAVEYGLKQLLSSANIDLNHKIIAAIGKKTAAKLERHKVKVVIVPQENFNTESFLDLAITQSIRGKRILIFRGKGGRERLANTLQQRGAKVEYTEVYRRICPEQNTDELKSRWRQQLLDMIVITSSEGLHNLYSMCNDDWIKSVPLLLGSQRMKTAAMDLGHLGTIIVSKNPSDEAVLSSLLTWGKQESN